MQTPGDSGDSSSDEVSTTHVQELDWVPGSPLGHWPGAGSLQAFGEGTSSQNISAFTDNFFKYLLKSQSNSDWEGEGGRFPSSICWSLPKWLQQLGPGQFETRISILVSNMGGKGPDT